MKEVRKCIYWCVAMWLCLIFAFGDNLVKVCAAESENNTQTVQTTSIKTDSTYVVLKIGESHKLAAKAVPEDANQSITYRAVDNAVINVSSTGNITGRSIGTTTVLVSNGDYQTAVTVIVNVGSDNKKSKDEHGKSDNPETSYNYEVHADDRKSVTSEQLSNLYYEKQALNIKGDGYKIVVDGKDIVNYDNELLTDIELKKEGNNTTFVINDNKPLCGDIIISFDEEYGKYVYLYNQTREKYELLGIDGTEELVLSSPGKYMITDRKITVGTDWIVYVLITLAVIIVGGSVAYIVVKKRYWFW